MSAHLPTGEGGPAAALADDATIHAVDVKLVRDFWRSVERVPAGASLGGSPFVRSREVVIVSGWVAETRVLPDGRRQIFCFLLPGDIARVSSETHLGRRGLVALTNVEVADTDAPALKTDWPRNIQAAIRRREDRLFDHIVRIGCLTARERVLNLLLELCERLESIGLVKDNTFRIPLTQEVFADALGLSVVHINRTFQQLRREGQVTVSRGFVTLHQRQKLPSLACHHATADEYSPVGDAYRTATFA